MVAITDSSVKERQMFDPLKEHALEELKSMNLIDDAWGAVDLFEKRVQLRKYPKKHMPLYRWLFITPAVDINLKIRVGRAFISLSRFQYMIPH